MITLDSGTLGRLENVPFGCEVGCRLILMGIHIREHEGKLHCHSSFFEYFHYHSLHTKSTILIEDGIPLSGENFRNDQIFHN